MKNILKKIKSSRESQKRKPKAHLNGSTWSNWIELKEENNISLFQLVKQEDNKGKKVETTQNWRRKVEDELVS